MARSNSAAFVDEDDSDDLDVASQATILRRAVAELAISPQLSADKLAASQRLLTHFYGLAEAILGAVHAEISFAGQMERACSKAAAGLNEVRTLLGAEPAKRSERAAVLEAARRKLYASLASIGEELAHDEAQLASSRPLRMSSLDRALLLRSLISDFRGALLVDEAASGANVRWALQVADSELAILLRHRTFTIGEQAIFENLAELRARIERWRAGRRDSLSGARLYEDVVDTSSLLTELNLRPDVQRHDAHALELLDDLLSDQLPSLVLAAQAADTLSTLRGFDSKLDALMVTLPLDPDRALSRISRRVRTLSAKVVLN